MVCCQGCVFFFGGGFPKFGVSGLGLGVWGWALGLGAPGQPKKGPNSKFHNLPDKL